MAIACKCPRIRGDNRTFQGAHHTEARNWWNTWVRRQHDRSRSLPSPIKCFRDSTARRPTTIGLQGSVAATAALSACSGRKLDRPSFRRRHSWIPFVKAGMYQWSSTCMPRQPHERLTAPKHLLPGSIKTRYINEHYGSTRSWWGLSGK